MSTRGRPRASWLGVALAGMAVFAGCALVTDLGTGGYKLAPGGCHSSADCDGGVCCLVSTTAPVFACSASCSVVVQGTPAVQLCALTTECSGSLCVEQQCPWSESLGAPTVFAACGTLPMCTILEILGDAAVPALDAAAAGLDATSPTLDAPSTE